MVKESEIGKQKEVAANQNISLQENIASELIDNQDKLLMVDLADVLESGEVISRRNSAIDGDIRVKRGGMNEGLVHLIDHRIRERVLNKNIQMNEEQAKKETCAILFLAIDNIDKVPAEKEANGHYAVYNKGIKTVIGKDRNGRYVVTGYDNKQTEVEATESINAVIAQYGNTPEFLGIYAQVGAVIASNNILTQTDKKTSPQNDFSKDKYNALVSEYNGLLKEHDEVIDDYNKLLTAYNKSQEENKRLQKQIQSNKKEIRR